jgi:hypothetical protein
MKKKKIYRQPWSDNVIYETKRQINSLGNKIKHNPNNNVLKQKYFTSNIAFLISLYVIVESDSALYIMFSSIVFNWFSISFLKLELK